MASKRFQKSDWTSLGLEAMRTNGIDALTVELLCEKALKTRGSFYFHFETIDAFLIQITQQWLETYTTKIIQNTPDNTQRKDLLNQLAGRLDLDLETEIRKLASINPNVQTIVSKADRLRIQWLGKQYEATQNYSPQEAHALAKIEIAAFTGFRLIDPQMPAQEARKLYESFLKLTNRA